jgi:hypothetical protein
LSKEFRNNQKRMRPTLPRAHLDTATKTSAPPHEPSSKKEPPPHEPPFKKGTSSPRPSPPQVCGGEGDETACADSWVQCSHAFGEISPHFVGRGDRRPGTVAVSTCAPLPTRTHKYLDCRRSIWQKRQPKCAFYGAD